MEDTDAVFPNFSHVDKSKDNLSSTNDVPLMVLLWPMTALREGLLLYEQCDLGCSRDL